MGKVRSGRAARKHGSQRTAGTGEAAPSRDDLIEAVRQARETEGVGADGVRPTAGADGVTWRGSVPTINLALLFDGRRDRMLEARLRAICEHQGISVVDIPLAETERRWLARETEIVGRRVLGNVGWYHAQMHAEWEREAIAWTAKHRGGPGTHRNSDTTDPLDLPLSAGRTPAMLMALPTMMSEEDADKIRCRYATHRETSPSRPSLPELQMARALCRAVDNVVVTGSADSWTHLRKAYHAIFTAAVDVDHRIAILEEGIRLFRCVDAVDEQLLELTVVEAEDPADLGARFDPPRSASLPKAIESDREREERVIDGDRARADHAERVRRDLVAADDRYEGVDLVRLTALLREGARTHGRRGAEQHDAARILAEIDLACGLEHRQKRKPGADEDRVARKYRAARSRLLRSLAAKAPADRKATKGHGPRDL